MCGICGIKSPVLGETLSTTTSTMNQALLHRGPDDGGQYINGICSLAMCRLSIIDVAGGDQPLANEDGRLTIVFNGEIYNYRELTETLIRKGHHFRTQSDTEAIVHLYEDEGANMPQHLKGMFALCIHDQRDDSLFLARDRFGEKPLYYYNHPDKGFIFSSEVRSLLTCPLVPRQLNREALGYYLRTGLVPAPLTLLQDVWILPPGHWLKYQNGQITVRPYYMVDYIPDRSLNNEADAAEAVQAALQTAVDRQSISEVPLGAFLSGGIDSSAVVATLQSILPTPAKTFTIRFEEAAYDESAIAREVATRLKTDHQEFVVPNVGFQADDLWRIIDHVGLPFIDSSAIPTYVLSKHVSQEVTVALSGDGGDEMFAGYPFFQWGSWINRLSQLPQPLLQSGAFMSTWLSKQGFGGRISSLRRVRRALDASLVPAHFLPVMVHTIFEPAELQCLIQDKTVFETATSELPLLSQLPPEAENWSLLRRLMYYRLKHNLPDDMLTKVDRMSMACSLEVRAPMLDVDLANLSMRLPDKHLIKHGAGKFILRQAMQGSLPDSVFNHPKSGFSIPLHRFQNEEYIALAQSLLSDRTGIMGLFNKNRLATLSQIALTQQLDRADLSVYRASHQLWGVMQLAAWGQRFGISI